MNLTIKKGNIWAGPLFNRIKFNFPMGGTFRNYIEWNICIKKIPESVSIKLPGLAYVTPHLSRVRHNKLFMYKIFKKLQF